MTQSGLQMLAEQVASAVESYRRFTGDYPVSFIVTVEPSARVGVGTPLSTVRLGNVVLKNPDAVDLEDTDGNR